MPNRPNRVAFLSLVALNLAHAGWVPVGPAVPEGEFVWDLKVHGSSLFAVVDDQGAYRGTELGTQWTPVLSGRGYQDISTMEAKDTVLYAGGLDGAFRSRDNGATWVPINKGRTSESVNSFAFEGNAVYAGTNFGLYQSVDEGESWSAVPSVRSLVYGVARNSTSFFLGMNSGTVRSRDKGITWDTVSPITLSPWVPDPDKATVFLAGGVAGIIRSMDDGNTWKPLPVPWKATEWTVGDLHRYKNLIFVAASSLRAGGLYYTPDLGDTWTKVDNQGLLDSTVNTVEILGEYIFVGTDSGRIFRRTLSEVLVPGAIAPPLRRLRPEDILPPGFRDAAGRYSPPHRGDRTLQPRYRINGS